MADVIIITPQPIIATATVFQDIRTAINVSMYDTLDVHVGALSVTGSSGTAVITFATAMQNLVDDTSWEVTKGVDAGDVSFANGESGYWRSTSLPESGKNLLKYLRYRITFTGSVTAVTVMITALGRRRSG